jgi:hypothetical protein
VIDNDTCIDAIGFGHTISSVLGSSPDDVHQFLTSTETNCDFNILHKALSIAFVGKHFKFVFQKRTNYQSCLVINDLHRCAPPSVDIIDILKDIISPCNPSIDVSICQLSPSNTPSSINISSLFDSHSIVSESSNIFLNKFLISDTKVDDVTSKYSKEYIDDELFLEQVLFNSFKSTNDMILPSPTAASINHSFDEGSSWDHLPLTQILKSVNDYSSISDSRDNNSCGYDKTPFRKMSSSGNYCSIKTKLFTNPLESLASPAVPVRSLAKRCRKHQQTTDISVTCANDSDLSQHSKCLKPSTSTPVSSLSQCGTTTSTKMSPTSCLNSSIDSALSPDLL